MQKLVFAPLVIGAAAALALTGSAASAKSAVEKGEAQLAKMVGGRTPGAPQQCISITTLDKLKVIDGVGITYRLGSTIYVSRVDRPEDLRWTDRARYDGMSPAKMCAGDKLWTTDIKTGTPTGSVKLLDFVPYTRQG